MKKTLSVIGIAILSLLITFFIYKEIAFFGWKSNLCIDERIFYVVHLSYKKEGSYYGNI